MDEITLTTEEYRYYLNESSDLDRIGKLAEDETYSVEDRLWMIKKAIKMRADMPDSLKKIRGKK